MGPSSLAAVCLECPWTGHARRYYIKPLSCPRCSGEVVETAFLGDRIPGYVKLGVAPIGKQGRLKVWINRHLDRR